MRAMKFKKISDEYNDLDFEEIIIVEQRILRERTHSPNEHNKKQYTNDLISMVFFDHEYIAIADNSFITIDEMEWCELSHCYQFVEFV